MKRISLRRPSASLVVAGAAVVMATAGTAVALPGTGTVNSGDIRDNTVKSIDVKDQSLTGSDIADGSLRIDDVSVASGSATNDSAIVQGAGTCVEYQFSAPGVLPGDRVVITGPTIADFNDASLGAPSVPNGGKLDVPICVGSGSLNTGVGGATIGYAVLGG